MVESWDAAWWLREVDSDPTYREEVLPLLIDLLQPDPEGRYLDMGCGEGQGMRTLAGRCRLVVGCDLDPALLVRAAASGPVVRCRLPDLGWLAESAFAAAFAVLVLEHLADHAALLAEVRRVVEPGGALVIVMNHPSFTAPGAGPLIDPADGEVSWRWGRYLAPGTSVEPAGGVNLTMHHRPLGVLLTAAAAAGWRLVRMVERGPGPEAMERDPLIARQGHFPRLLGLRFENRP